MRVLDIWNFMNFNQYNRNLLYFFAEKIIFASIFFPLVYKYIYCVNIFKKLRKKFQNNHRIGYTCHQDPGIRLYSKLWTSLYSHLIFYLINVIFVFCPFFYIFVQHTFLVEIEQFLNVLFLTPPLPPFTIKGRTKFCCCSFFIKKLSIKTK